MSHHMLGRIVVFHDKSIAPDYYAPAIITRVWTDSCVNLFIIPDTGEPFRKTSVTLDTDELQTQGWKWPKEY